MIRPGTIRPKAKSDAEKVITESASPRFSRPVWKAVTVGEVLQFVLLWLDQRTVVVPPPSETKMVAGAGQDPVAEIVFRSPEFPSDGVVREGHSGKIIFESVKFFLDASCCSRLSLVSSAKALSIKLAYSCSIKERNAMFFLAVG